jgi:hypothetical protein
MVQQLEHAGLALSGMLQVREASASSPFQRDRLAYQITAHLLSMPAFYNAFDNFGRVGSEHSFERLLCSRLDMDTQVALRSAFVTITSGFQMARYIPK